VDDQFTNRPADADLKELAEELEILVQDRNSPESPASELGGGYSNLIGIAFRIALQKMILVPTRNSIRMGSVEFPAVRRQILGQR
jgi:hypothetical protein